MKQLLSLFVFLLLLQACNEEKPISSIDPINWEKRSLSSPLQDSLLQGSTYLPVYSQIYSQTEHRTLDLTVTVSMRNTNLTDTLYIRKTEYFDTKGNPIRTYFDKPIFIAPMETVEIVIDELDKDGGTGANFLFHWTTKPLSSPPLFEAVMISTFGQGISFSTRGEEIR